MFGIVIASHGTLGQALIESAEMILEEKSLIQAVSVSNLSVDPEKFQENLLEAVDQASAGVGVIIFTDLFGGTPCNLAVSVMGLRPVEIIAGVNLPMILKAIDLRNQNNVMSLNQIAVSIEKAGQKQISIVSKLI